MIKRKGQIIPRNIISASDRKYQHLFVFGCDVMISGNKVRAIDGGVCCFYTNRTSVKRPSKTTIVRGMKFGDKAVFYGFKYVLSATGIKNQIIEGLPRIARIGSA